MATSMFMCYRYDTLRGDAPVSCPCFFRTYEQAKKHAIQEAYICESKFLEIINYWLPKSVFYIKIFEIDFGYDTVITHDPNYHNDELYEMCIETVYDPETTAAMLIQKRWREIYNKRFVAAVIIKRQLKKAIANPYTELCKRRLMREFHEISNDF